MRIRTAFLVFFVLSITMSGNVFAKDFGNMLQNGSFEVDPVGYKGSPAGWQWREEAENYLQIVADSPFPEFGNRSLLIDYRQAGYRSRDNWYIFSSPLPIKDSGTYRQSCWLKTDGQIKGYGGSFARQFLDSNEKPIGINYSYAVRHSGAKEWAAFNQVLVPERTPGDGKWEQDEIPQGTCYVQIRAGADGYPGRVWFDSLRFEEISPNAGPLDGPLEIGDNMIAFAEPVKSPVSIDGELSEDVWQASSQWNGDFRRTICKLDAVSVAENQTRFKVAYDKDNVYFAIICESADTSAIVTQPYKHSNPHVCDGDDIEIFLDPSGNKEFFYQLCVNPSGSIYESWGGGVSVKAAAVITPKGWLAEISIPKRKLGQLYQETGRSIKKLLWHLNITRHYPAGGTDQYTSWSYTGSSSFHNKKTLGTLLFDKPKNVLCEELSNANQQLRRLASGVSPPKDALADPRLPALLQEMNGLLQSQDYILEHVSASARVSKDSFARYSGESRRAVQLLAEKLSVFNQLAAPLPENRKKYGYLLYRTPLFERPNAGRVPKTEELIDALSIRLAANEYSPATFSLFSKVDLKDVDVTWTSLVSEGGNTIAKSEVDLRILEPWAKQPRTADILATDLRVELDGWLSDYASRPRHIPLIAENTSRKLWVLVHAGVSQPAGLYRGMISIEPAGRPATKIPIVVEVLPYALGEAQRDVGFYYENVLDIQPNKPALGDPGYGRYYGVSTEDRWLTELKALRRAGFNFISLHDYLQGPMDPEYSRKILSLTKAAGFEKVVLVGSEHIIVNGLPQNEKERAELKRRKELLHERVSKIYEIAGEIGIKELYIYGSDEPNDENAIARNIIIGEAVHSAGGKTACAIIFDDIRKSLEGVIDVPWMNPGFIENEIQRYAASKGNFGAHEKVLYYSNQLANTTPNVRIHFGWYLYKSGLSGNIPWCYYWLSPKCEPFEAHYLDPAFYVFPTKDEPIPTLKFEAAREGVTDLRYLEMLESAIANCKNQQKTEKARSAFNAMLSKVSLDYTKGIHSHNHMIPPEEFEGLRKQMQDLILDLCE